MKKYFALKLLPCRPDFAQTMTADEKAVMQQHIVYWREHMKQGRVVVFGPVLHPEAVYGLGIVAVDDENEVKNMINEDPACLINSYEYFLMMAVVPGNNI